MQIEAIWHAIFRRTFWERGGGPVVYGGMSTIDEALWDIKGRRWGAIYDLLGGKVRGRDSVYANGWYSGEWAPGSNRVPVTPEDYGEIAAEVVALGYDGLKFNPSSHPAARAGPTTNACWSRGALISYARVRRCTWAVGPDVAGMIECHGLVRPDLRHRDGAASGGSGPLLLRGTGRCDERRLHEEGRRQRPAQDRGG